MDFELEDVWKLPTPGGPDGLARLVQQAVDLSDGSQSPAAFRALFALRRKVGELFGWDEADSGVDERVPSLRERLPTDLLEGPRGPDLHAVRGGRKSTVRRSLSRSIRRVTNGCPSTPARPYIR